MVHLYRRLSPRTKVVLPRGLHLPQHHVRRLTPHCLDSRPMKCSFSQQANSRVLEVHILCSRHRPSSSKSSPRPRLRYTSTTGTHRTSRNRTSPRRLLAKASASLFRRSQAHRICQRATTRSHLESARHKGLISRLQRHRTLRRPSVRCRQVPGAKAVTTGRAATHRPASRRAGQTAAGTPSLPSRRNW